MKTKREQYGTQKNPTTDIRTVVRNYTNFKSIIRMLNKRALGKYKVLKYNTGELVDGEPDLAAARLLLEYGFGKPEQITRTDTESLEQMKELTEVLSEVVLPKQKQTVTEATELTEGRTENVDSGKVASTANHVDKG